MPWTAADAKKKTKKATTAKKSRQWEHVANSERAAGKNDATAIKAANSVVKKSSKGKRKT